MRIAIGQLLQETNSLNPVLTRREDFELYGLARGAAVVSRYGEVGELAGFAALPDELGAPVEWLGMLRAVAWSGGPLAQGLLAELIEGMTAPLRETIVDGVLLSLHGAQSAVDEVDVSGRMLAAVRSTVGPDVPIVATLDLHANVTPLMAQSADVLVGYHTFPHVDHVSCGRRAAHTLARMLRDDIRPCVRVYKIPMVVSSEGRATDHGVQAELWRQIIDAETRTDVASVGLYMVQPWLDAPWLGWTLYQAYFGDTAPFDEDLVGDACWRTRRHRQIDYVTPANLLSAARAITGGPIAVSEGHDATNSGATGDSTQLLTAMVAEQIGEGGGLCFCVDPEAVAHCTAAGVGATVSLTIGGRRDPFSEPLAVQGTVDGVGELRYTLSGHGGHNLPVDMGRMARLRVGDTTIVLVQETGPGSSPQLYTAAGVDPCVCKIVLAKSPEGFRADYESFSAGILYAAAPGCATPFIEQILLQHSTHPIFPFDDLDSPSQAAWAGLVYERGVRP
jgi:microcystin degradation protein MlrC